MFPSSRWPPLDEDYERRVIARAINYDDFMRVSWRRRFWRWLRRV